MRRFRGEGWPLEYPWTSGAIKARRTRLQGLVVAVLKAKQKFEQEEEEEAQALASGKPAKKKQDMVPVDQDLPKEELNGAALSAADLRLLELSSLAQTARDQGTVDFYGCSKCRYSRGDCINYQ